MYFDVLRTYLYNNNNNNNNNNDNEKSHFCTELTLYILL